MAARARTLDLDVKEHQGQVLGVAQVGKPRRLRRLSRLDFGQQRSAFCRSVHCAGRPVDLCMAASSGTNAILAAIQ